MQYKYRVKDAIYGVGSSFSYLFDIEIGSSTEQPLERVFTKMIKLIDMGDKNHRKAF